MHQTIHPYSPDSRLLAATISLVIGLVLGLHIAWMVIPLLLLAILIAWDALRHATVWPAFDAFKQHQFAAMRLLLNNIRWPSLLAPQSLAYYNWLKGIDDVHANRLAAAKVHLLAAASGPIHTENDRSLIHCLLAEVAIQEGDTTVAKEHLQHAGALSSQQSIREMINRLQQRIE